MCTPNPLNSQLSSGFNEINLSNKWVILPYHNFLTKDLLLLRYIYIIFAILFIHDIFYKEVQSKIISHENKKKSLKKHFGDRDLFSSVIYALLSLQNCENQWIALNPHYIDGLGWTLSYKTKGIEKNEGKPFLRKEIMYSFVRSKEIIGDMCSL